MVIHENNEDSHMTSSSPLRLVVLDLDYTIWDPEVCRLYGKPRLQAIAAYVTKGGFLSEEFLQEARTTKEGHIISDDNDQVMRVFPGA